MNYYYTSAPLNDDELQHYGVVGMKWGIRRGKSMLAKASTKEERDKAVTTLNKHKEKASNKIAKLEKKGVKLEAQKNKAIIKADTSAANIRQKAAIKRNKSYRLLMSERRRQKLRYKADKLDARAAKLIASSDIAKSKVVANETMIKMFKRGINDIDTALVDKGKRYIRG